MTVRDVQNAFLRALDVVPGSKKVYVYAGEDPRVLPASEEQWWAMLLVGICPPLRRRICREAWTRLSARILVERGDRPPRRVRESCGPVVYVGAEYVLGPLLDPLYLAAAERLAAETDAADESAAEHE